MWLKRQQLYSIIVFDDLTTSERRRQRFPFYSLAGENIVTVPCFSLNYISQSQEITTGPSRLGIDDSMSATIFADLSSKINTSSF